MNMPVFIANWKMFLSLTQIEQWCEKCSKSDSSWTQKKEILVCPESIYLPIARTLLTSNIGVGAQDCSIHQDGAFTGEISSKHFAEMGIRYTLVGHHEQRVYHHETDEFVAKKAITALQNGVTPIICLATEDEASTILGAIAQHIPTPVKLICAYEPPQSIGTGIIPPPDEIEAFCKKIKEIIKKNFFVDDFPVLYGGSVNEELVKKLQFTPSVQGLLIGKASTDFQAFKNIVLSFMNRTL